MDKQATPIAAQLAMAILGVSLLGADSEHAAEQRAEAEVFNELARQAEAKKMEQTTSALKHAAAQLGPVLRAAAQETLVEMDKAAGLVGGLLSQTRKSFGGAAQAAGRLLPKLSPAQKVVGAGMAIGGAYTGYKGLQAVRDYAERPAHHGAWGKGPPIQHDINAYGYPQY